MRGPRILLVALLLGSAAAPAPAGDEAKIFRVGVLFWHDSDNDARAYEGVKEGFRIAGMGFAPEVVNLMEDEERGRAVLRRWETEGYDLVYAMGTDAALLAKSATRTIPVVFTAVTNPVASVVVDSWEGSGTNLCGNSNWIAPGDLFRVFQETVPGLARLGIVLNRNNKVSMEELGAVKRYFSQHDELAIRLIEEGISGPDEIEEAVRAVLDRGAEALWIPIDIDVVRNLDRIAAITMPLGIPLLASQASAVETHAIVSVAVDYRALGRNSVVYAKKVLVAGDDGKKADPGGLPVGRMHSFDVTVNLGAARRTGYEIPLTLLAVVDEIRDPDRPAGEVR